MSFLSRKPARPQGRGGGAGRDDEYDDFDGYAHDAYQNEDDGWSPNEYFSPEGIKGRWAGEHPEGRSGGRGRRDGEYGETEPGYDSRRDDFGGPDYGGAPGYGADEFAAGAYDLPDGADDDRSDRNRRRRRDREDRGERTGILRLRRDRGEDIWPDDGISDEDYWASVAADRPLNGADSPPDDFPGAAGGSRPVPDGRRPRTDARPAPGGGADARFGEEQRDGRNAAGRLGPPPGLSGQYKPGAQASSGPLGTGQRGRPGGGGRGGSGPMPARPGTGPQAARPVTGPTPTVGVTSSRPPAGQSGMRPGQAQPGTSGSGFPSPATRPSFQPNGYHPGQSGGQAAARTQDRADWGERTERIDRVSASGYPDPRPGGRAQGPGGQRGSGPLGTAAGFGSAPSAAPGQGTPPGRGRGDQGRGENPWQAPERRDQDRRDHGREAGRPASGAWPSTAADGGRARGGDDDPLTSTAYSRSAHTDTDGRSYRAAARRSQAQTKLTDHAETFITGPYQADRAGEYWYRDDAPATVTPATAARYPASAGQPTGRHGQGNQAPASQGGHPAQPGRSQASAGYGQAPPAGAQPGQPGPGGGRAGQGMASGQYDGQQPRPAQQREQAQQQQPQHRQPQHRQPGPGRPPAAALPSAGTSGGSAATAAAGPAAGGTPNGGARAAASGGQNPYDTGTTGSYPYPGQSYNARQAAAGPVQSGADDRYYRPSGPDRYPGQGGGAGQGRAEQRRGGQGRGGHGNGYPADGRN